MRKEKVYFFLNNSELQDWFSKRVPFPDKVECRFIYDYSSFKGIHNELVKAKQIFIDTTLKWNKGSKLYGAFSVICDCMEKFGFDKPLDFQLLSFYKNEAELINSLEKEARIIAQSFNIIDLSQHSNTSYFDLLVMDRIDYRVIYKLLFSLEFKISILLHDLPILDYSNIDKVNLILKELREIATEITDPFLKNAILSLPLNVSKKSVNLKTDLEDLLPLLRYEIQLPPNEAKKKKYAIIVEDEPNWQAQIESKISGYFNILGIAKNDPELQSLIKKNQAKIDKHGCALLLDLNLKKESSARYIPNGGGIFNKYKNENKFALRIISGLGDMAIKDIVGSEIDYSKVILKKPNYSFSLAGDEWNKYLSNIHTEIENKLFRPNRTGPSEGLFNTSNGYFDLYYSTFYKDGNTFFDKNSIIESSILLANNYLKGAKSATLIETQFGKSKGIKKGSVDLLLNLLRTRLIILTAAKVHSEPGITSNNRDCKVLEFLHYKSGGKISKRDKKNGVDMDVECYKLLKGGLNTLDFFTEPIFGTVGGSYEHFSNRDILNNKWNKLGFPGKYKVYDDKHENRFKLYIEFPLDDLIREGKLFPHETQFLETL